MKNETIDGRRLIDIPSYRDRAMALQARVFAMKFNGMRVLSHHIKNEEPGLPRWIVKLQGCELNHQTASLAIDVMGELGILYDGSPYIRDQGMWQHRYMMDLGLIIGGGNRTDSEKYHRRARTRFAQRAEVRQAYLRRHPWSSC